MRYGDCAMRGKIFEYMNEWYNMYYGRPFMPLIWRLWA